MDVFQVYDRPLSMNFSHYLLVSFLVEQLIQNQVVEEIFGVCEENWRIVSMEL